ncbi:MAG: hypothetical protein ND895_20770 [Pyrinomonadaceae bacterium]|nr:hypothetical protein [Pyrinomonadaceae bacterium]
MSEVKLNLTDAQHTICGTIHASVADRCIAALSAEPETIAELEAALARYDKPTGDVSPFGWFHKHSAIDGKPWDAGIVIIDLAARIVASESTYSRPGPQGEVSYHDGTCATDTSISYRLPHDWLFLDQIDDYEGSRDARRRERLATPPLDARAILYGRPLLEFIACESWSLNQQTAESRDCNGSVEVEKALAAHVGESTFLPPVAFDQSQTKDCSTEVEGQQSDNSVQSEILRQQISQVHARWLMTPRDDLQGHSPRELLLARQDLIDYDMHTRSMQWSMLGEGPPCLATDSFAYRFAGFGTHEWVIYYDLVRHLLSSGLQELGGPFGKGETEKNNSRALEAEIARLERLQKEWLEQPQEDYGGRIPALLIENERIRLPIAMRVHDMVVDDDCPVCQMMANDAEWGMDVGFWHLDGSHMDDDFAFSDLRTREEWKARQREWEEFTEKFNREWEERQHLERLTGSKHVEDALATPELPQSSDELVDSTKPVS